MKKIIFLLLLIVLVVLSSGCVYYNTFFLARKNYRLAERSRLRSTTSELPSKAKNHYDISIRKSSKVLAFYPESKWVDDALFMLGMCFYRTGEYTKAVRKFDELLEAFPQSEFVAEAQYWRTLCSYELGEFESALDKLKELAQNGDFAERSAFMVAEMFYEKEDYISARQAYLEFLEKFPGGRYKSLVHFRLAEIAYFYEEYFEAISQAGEIDKKDVTPAEFFDSRMLIGESYTQLDSLKRALSHYREIRKNEDFYDRWPEVDLKIGDVHYLAEDTTSAIFSWSEVCKLHTRTEHSAWGWFKRGSLHLDFGSIAIAKAEFDSAAAQVSSGEVRELALQKSASIAKLQEFQDMLDAENDSVEVDVVGTELALAEMYLLELNQPDSALSEYRFVVENYPEDSLAPKAAYGIGWVYFYSMNEREKADSAFAEVLKKYPESDYAVGAADYFVGKGAALDSMGVRTVAYYFVKGEENLFTYGRIDSALHYYKFVCDSFPESQYFPKALSARAYIHENETYKYEVAESLYQFLADSFSTTEYARIAQVRLGNAAPSFEKEKPPESVADTTGAMVLNKDEEKRKEDINTRRTDGRQSYGRDEGIVDPTTGEFLPRAPRPIHPVELRYPQEEWSSDLQGRVIRMKVRINSFGEAEEVELFRNGSCGNEVIDRAALQGVEDVEWRAEDIPIEYINEWFFYEIRVTKPKLTIDRSN